MLRKLSLNNIYIGLIELILYLSCARNVFNLASYLFNKIVIDNKLPALLVNYCVCIIKDLVKNEGFKD